MVMMMSQSTDTAALPIEEVRPLLTTTCGTATLPITRRRSEATSTAVWTTAAGPKHDDAAVGRPDNANIAINTSPSLLNNTAVLPHAIIEVVFPAPCIVTSLHIETRGVSHISVEGVTAQGASASDEIGVAPAAVALNRRKELVSVFEHKQLTQNRSTGGAKSGDAEFRRYVLPLVSPDAPLVPVPGAPAVSFRKLHVHLFEMWEPVTTVMEVMEDSLRVMGRRSCAGDAVVMSTPLPFHSHGAGDGVPPTPTLSALTCSVPAASPPSIGGGGFPQKRLREDEVVSTDAPRPAVVASSPSIVQSVVPAPLLPPRPAPPAKASLLPLSGCVIVLSGFVNPLRGELRDKATMLGAVVKNDWDVRDCTHLVAAVANTPKYHQVAQSPKAAFAVAKEWVLTAHAAQSRPSEETYRLPNTSSATIGGHRLPPPATAALPPPPGTTGQQAAADGGKPLRMVL